MMIKSISIIVLVLSIMISIAFFTLMERKLISYSQNRKGPNKVAVSGILQPIADAIKLISKELNLNSKSNFLLYLISPMMNILVSLTIWSAYPFLFTFSFMKMSLLFIVVCMSINAITVITMSWSSNSNYAFIGMIRSVAQLISYEINFMLIMMSMMNATEQMNLNLMQSLQNYMKVACILPIMLTTWMITVLAETARAPFDFSEGESELVSGFNIEYSSKSFMFLFLAEYASILFLSFMTALMFFASKNYSMIMVSYLMTCFFFVWTRATLPRFRYDKLMKFNWSQLLPTTTTLFLVTFMMKMYN